MTFEGAVQQAASDILKMLMDAMADPEGGVGIDQVTALIDGHIRPTLANQERIRERDGEWVDAIEDTLHFGIIPETLAGAVECMKAWLEEREARIEWVKEIALEIALEMATCMERNQLLAALDGETKPAISGPQPEDFTDLTADEPKKGGVDG